MKNAFNPVYPYDQKTCQTLLADVKPKNSECSAFIVHNQDTSRLYSPGYSTSTIDTSSLDILINPRDVNQLISGKLHGKHSYGYVLPHTHNVDMYTAVAIPKGVPFAVYTETLDFDSEGGAIRQFTVFNQDHEQTDSYNALHYEQFQKLDPKFRPLMTDTADTLKYMYFSEIHDNIVNDIQTNSSKFSTSFAKNGFYARRSMSHAVSNFMPEYEAVNIFDVNSKAHNMHMDTTRTIVDAETSKYLKLKDERFHISKIDEKAQTQIKEEYRRYDAVVTDRCNREVKLFLNATEDQPVEFKTIRKFLSNQLTATDLNEQDLLDIDKKASDVSKRRLTSTRNTPAINLDTTKYEQPTKTKDTNEMEV